MIENVGRKNCEDSKKKDPSLGIAGFDVSCLTVASQTLGWPLGEDRYRVISFCLFIRLGFFNLSPPAQCLLHKRPSINREWASKLIKLSFKWWGYFWVVESDVTRTQGSSASGGGTGRSSRGRREGLVSNQSIRSGQSLGVSLPEKPSGAINQEA